MRARDWEIWQARHLLEVAGFVIRKPGDARVPVRMRLIEDSAPMGMVPLRIDTEISGVPYALAEHFPLDMILNEDFRQRAMPSAYARKLAQYIAERLLETLPHEMETALAPLVAKAEEARDRMSLREITTFIDRALNDPEFDADLWEADRLEKRRNAQAGVTRMGGDGEAGSGANGTSTRSRKGCAHTPSEAS